MAGHITKIRISNGEELQIDYNALANLPTAKYSTEEKNKLEGIEEGSNKTTIVDNLTSTSATSALSAKQGKALNDSKVPNTRTVNGKALSNNISLSASDVGALSSSGLTESRVLISNSSGNATVSTITTTELGYLNDATGNIQTQINSKQATITGAATTITGSDLTASRALVSNSSGKVAVSSVTSTELGYLDGVTSSVQTQINNKADLSGGKVVATQATSPVSSFTANKTITSSDNGKFFYSNSTSELTVTIPDDSNIPTGAEIEFCRFGSGALKITCASTLYFYGIGATSGVGTKTYSITDRYGCAALKKIGNTTWIISGAVEFV